MIRKIFNDIIFFKLLVMILGLIGCLTVFTATFSTNANFAIRQLTWFLIGLCTMELISRQNFQHLIPLLNIFSYVSVFLLWSVLILGIEINGMRGWFKFGSFLFQPSEFAKPFFVYTLCKFFVVSEVPLKKFLARSLILFFSFFLPILLEPDYGMTLIYVLTYLILVFLTTNKFKHLVLLIAFFGIIFFVLAISEPYILKRIQGYLYPFQDPEGAGWHILQFKFTIARGGVTGMGWGNSLWANTYLPLPHSDSAFATISEASGLFGTVPIIFLFSVLPFIGANFAKRQSDDFKSAFILLNFFFISLQGMTHILVNLGLIPPTGLTLPLLSYGGSSLFSTMLSIGLVISAINSK